MLGVLSGCVAEITSKQIALKRAYEGSERERHASRMWSWEPSMKVERARSKRSATRARVAPNHVHVCGPSWHHCTTNHCMSSKPMVILETYSRGRRQNDTILPMSHQHASHGKGDPAQMTEDKDTFTYATTANTQHDTLRMTRCTTSHTTQMRQSGGASGSGRSLTAYPSCRAAWDPRCALRGRS